MAFQRRGGTPVAEEGKVQGGLGSTAALEMAETHHFRVTSVTGTARLRSSQGTRRCSGELLVVDDDHGAIRVIAEGTDASADLRIEQARRVGDALLWRNDRGETLGVVGTVRSVGDAVAGSADVPPTVPGGGGAPRS